MIDPAYLIFGGLIVGLLSEQIDFDTGSIRLAVAGILVAATMIGVGVGLIVLRWLNGG